MWKKLSIRSEMNKRKRIRLSSEDLDDIPETGSQLPGDTPRPSLTIRYPPVYTEEDTSDQYQYTDTRQRRQSYPPFEGLADRVQHYPVDHGMYFGFQAADDSSYDQAVDFSLNRDVSQDTIQDLSLSHTALHTSPIHRCHVISSTSTSAEVTRFDQGQGYDGGQDRMSFLNLAPCVDQTYGSRQDIRGSVFQTDDVYSSTSLQHPFDPFGAFSSIPPGAHTDIDDTDPRFVNIAPGQCVESDVKPEPIVYYDMDTPQCSQSVTDTYLTSQYQIKEELDVNLHFKALLPWTLSVSA